MINVQVQTVNGTGSLGPIDWSQSGVDDIAQNVRMILLTPIGSQVLNRPFGIDSSFLDMPENIAINLFIAECVSKIPLWEPRARYKDISWKGDINGDIAATVTVEPNWNQQGSTALQAFPQIANNT